MLETNVYICILIINDNDIPTMCRCSLCFAFVNDHVMKGILHLLLFHVCPFGMTDELNKMNRVLNVVQYKRVPLYVLKHVVNKITDL